MQRRHLGNHLLQVSVNAWGSVNQKNSSWILICHPSSFGLGQMIHGEFAQIDTTAELQSSSCFTN